MPRWVTQEERKKALVATVPLILLLATPLNIWRILPLSDSLRDALTGPLIAAATYFLFKTVGTLRCEVNARRC